MSDSRSHTPIPIDIDPDSGFCFGVTSAIAKAEGELDADNGSPLYCLGDIVHNSDEVERLERNGLITISHSDLASLHNAKVLLRAHGEPPSTYETAKRNNIEIIDATCPVVLQLQRRIHATHNAPNPPQIVIYGKLGHAEVNGLVGQTAGTAIVVEDTNSLDKIDFSRPIAVYSQTTKPLEGFRAMCAEIRRRADDPDSVTCHDTICRRVSNRVEGLRDFALAHSVIIFVAGKKSSNGRVLFNHCLLANPSSHLISNADELQPQWLQGATSVGISGATSTPRWLMESVKERITNLLNQSRSTR